MALLLVIYNLKRLDTTLESPTAKLMRWNEPSDGPALPKDTLLSQFPFAKAGIPRADGQEPRVCPANSTVGGRAVSNPIPWQLRPCLEVTDNPDRVALRAYFYACQQRDFARLFAAEQKPNKKRRRASNVPPPAGTYPAGAGAPSSGAGAASANEDEEEDVGAGSESGEDEDEDAEAGAAAEDL